MLESKLNRHGNKIMHILYDYKNIIITCVSFGVYTFPCFSKEHTVDDEMNDVDGEEENEQSTSSIDVPQDFSMHHYHSDCMQSSETHQSSDEPMNSPICTMLITPSKELLTRKRMG